MMLSTCEMAVAIDDALEAPGMKNVVKTIAGGLVAGCAVGSIIPVVGTGAGCVAGLAVSSAVHVWKANQSALDALGKCLDMFD